MAYLCFKMNQKWKSVTLSSKKKYGGRLTSYLFIYIMHYRWLAMSLP